MLPLSCFTEYSRRGASCLGLTSLRSACPLYRVHFRLFFLLSCPCLLKIALFFNEDFDLFPLFSCSFITLIIRLLSSFQNALIAHALSILLAAHRHTLNNLILPVPPIVFQSSFQRIATHYLILSVPPIVFQTYCQTQYSFQRVINFNSIIS
jgi:hypothetical protein